MQESQLKVITECCDILSHISDGGKTLQLFCKKLAEAVNATACAAFYLNSRTNRLTLHGSYGFYVEEIQKLQPGNTLTERVLKNGRLLNTPLTKDYLYEGFKPASIILKRFGSLIVVPLFANNRTIGALTLGRTSRQAFPKKIVEICKVLAMSLASFFQNAELTSAVTSGRAALKPAPISVGAVAQPGINGSSFTGKPIVPGVSYGQCMVLANDEALVNVKIKKTTQRAQQRELLKKSYSMAKFSLEDAAKQINAIISEANTSIFEMHMMILEDPTLHERIESFLDEGYDLNSAIALTYKSFQDDFRDITDDYLRERFQDVEDVLLRLFNAATNVKFEPPKTETGGGLILVSRELLPSQLISAPLKSITGIVCESDGTTSHAAILARALRIPMLGGVPDIHKLVSSSDKLLFDCSSGLCVPNPSRELLQEYRISLAASRRLRETDTDLEVPVDDSPATTDGTTVKLCGNVTLLSEMAAFHAAGIREIGLYRTEFMFLTRNSMPDEETQFSVVSRLVANAGGAPVIIRALDIGGDKPLPYFKWDNELNPSLGWRGLRFLLSNPDFLQVHLRALLRACTAPNASLMFPMVADLPDLLHAKAAVETARNSLLAEGIPCGNPPIGMMLELPSAFVCLDQLLPHVDFISIGTNDLVQYLFAVDRANSHVTRWFRQCHPAVLKVLGEICTKVAKYPGKSLEICGELAGNSLATPVLIGAGLRKLSMNSSSIPAVRQYIRKLNLERCQKLFETACACTTPDEVNNLLRTFKRVFAQSASPAEDAADVD